MDPANGREALREIAVDEAEGADILLLKPAIPKLDLIAEALPARPPDRRVPGERRVRDAAAAAGGAPWTAAAHHEAGRLHRPSGGLDRRHVPAQELAAWLGQDAMTAAAMAATYIQALSSGWTRPGAAFRPPSARRRGSRAWELAGADDGVAAVRTFSYSMIGRKACLDLLLWRMGPEPRSDMRARPPACSGRHRTVALRQRFILGPHRASQYVTRPTSRSSPVRGRTGPVPLVYPFMKPPSGTSRAGSRARP